jgi:hypothetical protein
VWKPSKELLAWVATHQKLPANADFHKKPVLDPFMQEAMRVFPGLAPGDSFFINGSRQTLSLRAARNAIRTIYLDLLNRAWAEARARGEKLPPVSQKAIPPEVPGQQ